MISVAEAKSIIFQQTTVLGMETLELVHAFDRSLGEDVFSDIDMPPFHRSMMDGYAVRSADVLNAPVTLRNVGFIAAGDFPEFRIHAGETAKIMTGAPLPLGADSVREVELVESGAEENSVVILQATKPGLHVVEKASEIARGQLVLSAGTMINSAVSGVLATVGKPSVVVHRKPTVAILSTGDELIPPSENPVQGQIRNSNSYTLHAMCKRFGLECTLLGIVKDQRQLLEEKIFEGLRADLLLITGGVSMGDLDFVRDIFKKLELEIFFEKVKIKPGKPTVFAKHKNGLVFGLPGNPVSSSTVFEVLVRPAILKMMGRIAPENTLVVSETTDVFYNRSNRENYHPGITSYKNEHFFTRPLKTKGSGDIAGFAKHNSLLICPPEVIELPAGSSCKVHLCDNYFS
ncbi:MAG: molybdopterin molybdotransferase MoeA [Deferribacteres bacterium]|nr:molybdopterin molybdotransferase MoeA [candidate division KSB1 bacterium]MCB9502398.1 molybdopterin molybdotransferase MoeA [Deferribacteres bacterium]